MSANEQSKYLFDDLIHQLQSLIKAASKGNFTETALAIARVALLKLSSHLDAALVESIAALFNSFEINYLSSRPSFQTDHKIYEFQCRTDELIKRLEESKAKFDAEVRKTIMEKQL